MRPSDQFLEKATSGSLWFVGLLLSSALFWADHQAPSRLPEVILAMAAISTLAYLATGLLTTTSSARRAWVAYGPTFLALAVFLSVRVFAAGLPIVSAAA